MIEKPHLMLRLTGIRLTGADFAILLLLLVLMSLAGMNVTHHCVLDAPVQTVENNTTEK